MKKDNFRILYYIFIIFSEIYWFNGMAYVKMSYVNYISYPFIAIALISILIYFILSKYTIKQFLILILGVAISILYYIGTGMQFEGILTIVPSIMGLKGISIKKVVKLMLWTLVISFSVFTILNLIGVVPIKIDFKIGRDNSVYRMIELGGQHGNPLYLFVFCIISSYLYVHKQDLKIKHLCISLVVAIIAYWLFQSRTGFLLSLLLVFGVPIIRKIKKLNRIVERLLQLFPFVIVIAVVLFSTKLFDTHIAKILDTIITSRLSCANYYFEEFGVSLLPRYIHEYLVFDNMYAFMVVEYGIVFTIMYCFIYGATIKKLLENKKYVEVFFIIVYFLYSYCEKGFLKTFCNFPMLFIAYLLYDIFKEDKKKEINK